MRDQVEKPSNIFPINSGLLNKFRERGHLVILGGRGNTKTNPIKFNFFFSAHEKKREEGGRRLQPRWFWFLGFPKPPPVWIFFFLSPCTADCTQSRLSIFPPLGQNRIALTHISSPFQPQSHPSPAATFSRLLPSPAKVRKTKLAAPHQTFDFSFPTDHPTATLSQPLPPIYLSFPQHRDRLA